MAWVNGKDLCYKESERKKSFENLEDVAGVNFFKHTSSIYTFTASHETSFQFG